MTGNYISLLNVSRNSNYTSLISSNKGGGETAGTVARSFASLNNVAYMGGETAGSVACSSSSSGSSSGSFSAIA